MLDRPITWMERVENLRTALGRFPTLQELMLIVPLHNLTPEEKADQGLRYMKVLAGVD